MIYYITLQHYISHYSVMGIDQQQPNQSSLVFYVLITSHLCGALLSVEERREFNCVYNI